VSDPSIRARRRAEIVAAARQLIVDGGLEALTFGRLEKALPYTRGVITHHFADRDDIVDAVLASAVDEIDRATAEQAVRGMPRADQVRAVLRTKVHGFLSHPEAAQILLAFATRPPGDARAARVEEQLFARYRTESQALFRHHAQAEAIAAWMVGTVIGLVVQQRLGGGLDVDASIEVATTGLATFTGAPA
jgi:AcrR family transcriptional regulator